MEADLYQALLDMSMEQRLPQPVGEPDIFNPRKDFTHVAPGLRLQQEIASLRQQPKAERENDPPLPSAFLDKTEPDTRADLERIAAMGRTPVASLNHQRPDAPYHEHAERPNPQQALVEARELPTNVLQPEFTREIEFGRAPNPTAMPLQPYDPARPQEKESTRMPERAFGRFNDAVFGAPSTLHGVDETRYQKTLVMSLPERYLEETGGLARPSHQLSLPTVAHATDRQALPLRPEETLLLLEKREPVPSRDFGDSFVPSFVARDRPHRVLPTPIPGASRLGDQGLGARETPFALEDGRGPLPDRSVTHREPAAGSGAYTFEHITDAAVTLFSRLLEPPGRSLTQDDHTEPDLHIRARNDGPYAIY